MKKGCREEAALKSVVFGEDENRFQSSIKQLLLLRLHL